MDDQQREHEALRERLRDSARRQQETQFAVLLFQLEMLAVQSRAMNAALTAAHYRAQVIIDPANPRRGAIYA